jgi:hypothetical protein
VALAATGVAALYIDLIAVTTVYGWLSPPPALILAGVVAGAGLMLARRWDSQHLGLLVLVPLLVLAPVVTDGVTLLLIAFLLALSAASLPVQLGRDWVGLHAARTAAATLPLLAALVVRFVDSREDLVLAGACAVAALLAVVSALVLVPGSTRPGVVALLSATGVTPLLAVGLTADHAVAALMIAALAAALLAIVLAADRLPGVPGAPRAVFGATAAGAAMIAVSVAFDGRVAGPVLLAMSAAAGLASVRAGTPDAVLRWAAVGFGLVGWAWHMVYADPTDLVAPRTLDTATAVSCLASSVLLAAAAVSVAWCWRDEGRGVLLAGGAAVVYAVTTGTVTVGLLLGGGSAVGFYAGHMLATIVWIGLAAAAFIRAAMVPRARRPVLLSGGLALVAAAVAKLFLFDLGTLGGMFRVGAFLVVGLALLGMGAGYARFLERQDRRAVSETVE